MNKLMQLTLGFTLAVMAGTTWAATNQATDPGGGGVGLSSSGTLTINATSLSIGKEARDLSGNDLGATATIPSGVQFYFVLYVDNTASVDLSDVRFVDAIDTGAFTVDIASFQILNTVVSPGIEMTAGNDTAWAGSASWNALTWNSLTVAVDVDQLDWNLSTANQVTVGLGGGNGQLDIVKSTQADPTTDPRRVAVRFKVTMN